MLADEGIELYGRKKICESVASFKRMVLGGVRGKAGRVPVRVMRLEFVGKEGRALLGDITGVLWTTVHSEVFQALRGDIDEGSVLVLQEFSGILCLKDSLRSSREGMCIEVHAALQLRNIAKVFRRASVPPSTTEVYLSRGAHTERLKWAYKEEALEVNVTASRVLARRRLMQA